ncbi:MAG: 3-oxoacyl-ACP reductase family protein [Desulfobacterales bacterium]|jgi:3-oxoacyl-[acyl-carrier protein] reductase
MRLKEKTALITGGARGIGATTAFLFAAEGASVGIVDLREDGLNEIATKAGQKGLEIKTFIGDITQKDQIENVVNEFVQTFGRIDILVNNAGVVIPRPFFEKTVEDWESTLRVNLIGMFLCCQVVAKHMLDQKSGKIVNISSIRGIDHCGREGVMDYSASKMAVIGLTKTLAKELAPHINVNSVAPGHTKTEMTAPLPDEIKQNMIEGSYLKRMAEPEDIAKAILFMASDDANFITGQILLVDGGFSLKRT